jgi:hypothetical protein
MSTLAAISSRDCSQSFSVRGALPASLIRSRVVHRVCPGYALSMWYFLST